MSLHPDFVAELRKRFTGDIRLDPATRILYSTDASIYQIEPLGVVLPRTQDDLHAAVELAAEYNVPILPRGSGSSLAGQAIGEALILDCSRWLDNIVDITPESRTATVEPGVILSALNRAAAAYGLQFGPDPASAERATMGGVIGNNATGAHSILYGMTADHILEADVILSDGSLAALGEMGIGGWESGVGSRYSALVSAVHEIRQNYAEAIKSHWPSTWRNSAGYRLNYLLPWSPSAPPLLTMGDDRWTVHGGAPNRPSSAVNLAPLLAGSEGTLAVIRRATVNLVPRPKYTILGVLAYDSIPAACEAVPGLLRHSPSAVELIPQMLIRLARSHPAYASQVGWVQGNPAALLAVEFSGDRRGALKKQARGLGANVLIAESAEEQARVWNVRKVGLGILDSRPASERPVAFIEDCAVPVERLGEFVREVERILAAHGIQAAFYAHASAGCLHIRPILNLKSGEGVRALRSIAMQTLALTLRLDGSMASEHGDGIARAEWLRGTYGPKIAEAFRLLKQAADPQGLLNPQKMLDAPPMDTRLRYGAAYRAHPWPPALDFSSNNGLVGAIEQCNGQGVCRKVDGVMCPSFQATRDEMHSTRGRANLLRALITSPHPLPLSLRERGWGEGGISDSVANALDLCLACKGCKAECPSGVDMAKLKHEFQAEYYRSHHRPLRDYLFGYFNELVRLAAPFGGLVNWTSRNQVIRNLANSSLGISDERALPAFKRSNVQTFRRPDLVESCIFLPDTFTHFFEPEIEQAALQVLSACGVEVKVLPVYGAGRTLVSKGFLKAAKRHAAYLLDAIRRLDPERTLAVVGVEPSELYTLRDEFFDLLPERVAEVEMLAARAWLADEYLVRPGVDGEKRILRVANKPPQKNPSIKPKVTLHAHCYQKTQPAAADGFAVGQQASLELLHTIGYDVEVIPSGCCGMAGAFGYESEHYDVSIKVGELTLLPAIRKAKQEGKKAAAPGASCRAQILDGAGAEAFHPIALTAKQLQW